MNRRGFFKTLTVAVAGFTILPPATTYSRIWKAQKVLPYYWCQNKRLDAVLTAEYKANTLGILAQLEQCPIVLDLTTNREKQELFNKLFFPSRPRQRPTNPIFL